MPMVLVSQKAALYQTPRQHRSMTCGKGCLPCVEARDFLMLQYRHLLKKACLRFSFLEILYTKYALFQKRTNLAFIKRRRLT
jgi:hypothetical protein